MDKRKQNLIKWGLYPSFGNFGLYPSMLSVSHDKSSALSDLSKPKTHDEFIARAQANSELRKPEFETGPSDEEKAAARIRKSEVWTNELEHFFDVEEYDGTDSNYERDHAPSSPTNLISFLDEKEQTLLEDLADKTEYKSQHVEGNELWHGLKDKGLWYELWLYNQKNNDWNMIDGLNSHSVAKYLRTYLGPEHLKQSIDRINVIFQLNEVDGYTAGKVVKFKIVDGKRVPRYS